jgi:hypothetical protein
VLPSFISAPTAVSTRELTEFAQYAVIITADRLLLKKRLNASLFYKVGQKVEKKYLPRLFIVEKKR